MRHSTSTSVAARWLLAAVLLLGVSVFQRAPAQDAGQKGSSYMPVDITEDFATILARMKAAKPEVMQRQRDLLTARYDLSNRPAPGVTMTRGKAIQESVRVKLPPGLTWEQLSATSPDEIREKDLFPQGFLPLPHPNHAEGGMVFPTFHIDEN